MTVINKRLEPLFDAFCKKHCRQRVKKKCLRTGQRAALILCPIGEWWDLNDYLNDLKKAVDKIQSVIPSKL